MNVAKRVLQSLLIPGAERIVGRANVVRLARFLTNEVRLDGPNDMDANGERLMMRVVCERAGAGITVLDVGANVGDWAMAFLDAAKTARRDDVVVHAFEPCDGTHTMLKKRTEEADAARLFLHTHGMSDEPRDATMYVLEDGAGINSVHAADKYRRTETIKLDSIDAFAKRNGILHVTLVKSDTEGHDLNVLKGARELLSKRAISVIQFEYNWRWIAARNFLRDVFVLAGTDYRVGKLTPRGVEWYERWDPELETFREGNYVMCLDTCVAWFPAIRWWKLDA